MRQVYVPGLLSPGAFAEIEGEDYLHLTRSLRAKVGDPLRLVDTAFTAFSGRITAINRHSASVQADAAEAAGRESAPLVLGICVTANDAFDASLDAAVQLGATEIVPLQSARSRAVDESRLLRLQRIVRESCCQSLRLKPPRIASGQPLEDFLKSHALARRYIAWQGGTPGEKAGSGEALALLVGPEGGFEDAEISSARTQGWAPLSLGPHILRVPVAVSAGLGILQQLRNP